MRAQRVKRIAEFMDSVKTKKGIELRFEKTEDSICVVLEVKTKKTTAEDIKSIADSLGNLVKNQ